MTQRAAAIAVAVTLGALGAIQLAGPEALGLNEHVMAWLGIASAALGVLGSFLPKVQEGGE